MKLRKENANIFQLCDGKKKKKKNLGQRAENGGFLVIFTFLVDESRFCSESAKGRFNL